MIPDIKYQAVV